MKKKLTKYPEAKISCACGNVIETHSTAVRTPLKSVRRATRSLPATEIVDTEGRVDRFNRKYAGLNPLSQIRK